MLSLRSSIAGLSITAALAVATSVSAATVFDGQTFRGVQILGSTYDVSFHDGPFDAVFPAGELTFSTFSGAAAALNGVRSHADYQSLQPTAVDFGGFLVPYEISGDTVRALIGVSPRLQAGGTKDRLHDYQDQFTWAQFSLSAVPEPATWAMMIIGFGAAGSMVRRSRRRHVHSVAYRRSPATELLPHAS